jgi:hypothetical protein
MTVRSSCSMCGGSMSEVIEGTMPDSVYTGAARELARLRHQRGPPKNVPGRVWIKCDRCGLAWLPKEK